MKRIFLLAGLIAALGLTAIVQAQTLDETIVYIECKSGDGKTSVGSGVLISADGKVLTARHVIPEGSRTICEGVIGNAYRPRSRLIIRGERSDYDAAVLQFSGVTNSKYLKFCKLSDSLRRKPIFATGFPGKTKTGVPSSRIGVLSTVQPGRNGLIETDSATTGGMSGGMVTLANRSSLIGIIAGLEFDNKTGTPAYYGVLPAELIANTFGLTEEDKPRWESRITKGKMWQTRMGPVQLGVREDEGYCFITSVFGNFNNSNDKVFIKIEQNEFVLHGESHGTGTHGAYAQCIWY